MSICRRWLEDRDIVFVHVPSDVLRHPNRVNFYSPKRCTYVCIPLLRARSSHGRCRLTQFPTNPSHKGRYDSTVGTPPTPTSLKASPVLQGWTKWTGTPKVGWYFFLPLSDTALRTNSCESRPTSILIPPITPTLPSTVLSCLGTR